ncbi:MAG: hypothetical protein K8T91_04770 [Planctomycetes bacterium]|nr:hypothetical protein [Planctomycetota bacterium]
MSRVPSKSPPISVQPTLPPWGLRTTISFLLFIHLFMLGAAVLGSLSTSSPLMDRLVSITGIHQYLRLLHLNTAFQYSLADERDHRVVIAVDVPTDLKPARPASEGVAENVLTPAQASQYTLLPLMPDNTSPGIRRRRYLKLGQLLSQANEDSTLETFLAAALANGLLGEKQLAPPTTLDKTKQNHLLCLEVMPQTMAGFDELPEADRDMTAPRWQNTVFDGLVYPSGDHWGVTSRVNRSEASGTGPGRPAARPPAKNNKSASPAVGDDKSIPSAPPAAAPPATIPATQGSR